jgi:hypothetical protein
MKRGGNVSTQSWSGKSAVFLMESTLTFHGSSKSNKKPSDGRGISDYCDTNHYPTTKTQTDLEMCKYIIDTKAVHVHVRE